MKLIQFLLVLLLLLLLLSCSSRWHLKQAKRHEMLAVAKGATITPDTIYKEIVRMVPIPAEEKKVDVKPKEDSVGFKEVMTENDSLVGRINELQQEISSGMSLNKEKTMAELDQAKRRLSELKGQLSKRYLLDSTYRYKVDSITDVYFTINEGVISDVGYNRRETTIKFTDNIPVEVRKIFNAGYSRSQMIGGGILAIIALLAIGFTVGYIQGK